MSIFLQYYFPRSLANVPESFNCSSSRNVFVHRCEKLERISVRDCEARGNYRSETWTLPVFAWSECRRLIRRGRLPGDSQGLKRDYIPRARSLIAVNYGVLFSAPLDPSSLLLRIYIYTCVSYIHCRTEASLESPYRRREALLAIVIPHRSYCLFIQAHKRF